MRVPLFLALVIAAAVLPGCPTLGGSASKELSSAQFADIPVPDGFALDDSEGKSYSYTEGGSAPNAVRLGRLEYLGRGSVEAVLAWYASEMPRPLHGWTAPKAVAEGATSMMFTKDKEKCLVRVQEEGAALRLIVERNTGGAGP